MTDLQPKRAIVDLAFRGHIERLGIPPEDVRVVWTRHPTFSAEEIHLIVPDWAAPELFAELALALADLPVMFRVVHSRSGIDPAAGRAAFRLGGHAAVRALLDSL